MPDYPPEALAAAALAIHRAACPLRDDPDHDCARDAANEETFIPRARAALDAAAPVLAEDLRRKNKKLRKRVAELEPFEPRTGGLSVTEDGTPVVDVHFPESFAQLMLASFRWYLDEHEAPNYVQMPMTDMATGETYVCTIGRPGGRSPHEMRMAAEARAASLEAELAAVRASGSVQTATTPPDA